jgi:hypothetical protein
MSAKRTQPGAAVFQALSVMPRGMENVGQRELGQRPPDPCVTDVTIGPRATSLQRYSAQTASG